MIIETQGVGPAVPSVTLHHADVETLVRVMAGRTSLKKQRKALEWFYRYRGVPRPNDRTAEPTNIVSLRGARLRRDFETTHGPVIAAMLERVEAQQAAALLAFAIALEENIARGERIKARKARA